MRGVASTRHRGHVFTPIDGTYALIFDEEFNGSAVDTTQWFVHNSGTFDNAPALAANATVAASVCTLALAGSAGAFTGAFIHTSGSTGNFFVNGTNGSWYIEARCRMPAANSTGMWPAFWMNNAGVTPEIDIGEWRGSFPNGMPRSYFNVSGTETYHFGSFGDATDTPVESDLGLGHLGAAYHIYGMWWQAGSMTFYIDGVVVGTAINGVTQFSGTAIAVANGPYAINLTAGANGYGSNNNLSAGVTTFPGLFKIDYVHVYQKGGTPITPQTNYGGPGSTAGPTS